MEHNELGFKRGEKLGELILVGLTVALLVIMQMPIIPQPDKTAIYMIAVVYGVGAFIWHKIDLPIKPINKNFMESVMGLLVIFLVVHVSGGSASYLNFVYLFPNLAVSITSNKWQSFSLWILTSLLLFAEAFLFPQSGSFNFAVLNIWAIGLVSFYGRSIAHEVGSAQGAATAATIEKEKAINNLKDEFVFLISHELRGPISAIRGYLELFLTSNEKISEPVKKQANLAFKQSEKLNNLIIQLLDLSRLETEKFKLNNEKFDLNQFISASLDTVKMEAEEKKIKFDFRKSKVPAIVFSDKERIKEVVLNLIENAFSYTGEFGQVWVWVDSNDDQAHVSVIDTGVGLPPQELLQVFSRFDNSGGSSGEINGGKSKNTGLGLYLTKQLVEKMGGRISAESKLGKGSKFTFVLPLSKTA